MVCKPPRGIVLAHGGLWSEHSSTESHFAHADPFAIANRDDLAHGNGNVCCHGGVC